MIEQHSQPEVRNSCQYVNSSVQWMIRHEYILQASQCEEKHEKVTETVLCTIVSLEREEKWEEWGEFNGETKRNVLLRIRRGTIFLQEEKLLSAWIKNVRIIRL